jgi:Zn-dependent peptidase ImmA (M78 family)
LIGPWAVISIICLARSAWSGFPDSCMASHVPISYQEICKKMGIILIPYSELSERKQNAAKELSSDGFHLLIQDLHTSELVRLIYYNDSNTRERIRWIILHEIGHIVLDCLLHNINVPRGVNFSRR